MDVVHRGWRLLLSAAALAVPLAVASCAGGGGQGAVGVSERPRAGAKAREAADGGSRDGAAALPRGYRETFAKVNRARLVSQGHATGRWVIDVYANDAGAHALATRARDVAVGAVVVQEHYERGEGNGAGPVMVMEKRERGYAPEHGDWRYVVIGSAGQLVSEGVVASCAGCHDDAPTDGLFPVVE